MQFSDFQEIIEFAVEREREAQEFHGELNRMVPYSGLRAMLDEWVERERMHERVLRSIRERDDRAYDIAQAPDLEIADCSDDIQIKPGMEHQGLLVVGMKREEHSWKMYTDPASQCGDIRLKALFEKPAGGEAGHKLRLEGEYDTYIMSEN